jgi:uncharacterized protein YacL
MAEQSGTALPPITSPDTPTQSNSQSQTQNTPEIAVGPTSKDIMIGAGVMLVLAIVFFFVRSAFVNYLIGPSMKRSPNNAGMAGWGLFGGLFFGSVLGCIALVSKTLMTMPLIIVLSVLSLICFVMAFVVASK